MTDPQLAYQQQAAERALEFVRSGMVIGLGTGSTASFAIRRLADWLQDGRLKDIAGVPTSAASDVLARELAIPLTSLDEQSVLDLTIDGADEVDPQLNLIKGAGGALLREKMVAQASARMIVVVDDSKLSPRLGARRALPVEVIRFGWRSQWRFLQSLGAAVELRRGGDGQPYHTDNGNLILDCRFEVMPPLESLSAQLHMIGRTA
jgi:ribose 5-phosphate isomerase A